MKRGVEIVTTRSGSRAVLDHTTGEVMHPIGPRVEAEALYVGASRLDARLDGAEGDPLVLFDVGLGGGTNAATAWRLSEARVSGRPLHIVSFDRTVDAMALALEPENASSFALDGTVGDAARSLLETRRASAARTEWRLVLGDLPGTLESEPIGSADVVFWDPFSPKANPTLWNCTAFTALRRACRDGATVHTYSCATAVRSALLLAGFAVGVGPSTGAKERTTVAELVRAGTRTTLTEPLDARWLARLERSSAPFPPDAPTDAMDRVRALPQFDRPARS